MSRQAGAVMIERYALTFHAPGDRFEPPLPGAAYLSMSAVFMPAGCRVAVAWVQSVSAQVRAAAAAHPSKPSPPLTVSDREIVQDEHDKFDSMMAQFLGSNPGRSPSSTTLAELMLWSAARLEGPKSLANEQLACPARRAMRGPAGDGADSRIPLKCDEHIAKGLFESCRHWELCTGESLELRFAPAYSEHPVALILWEAAQNEQQPGVRLGDSTEADTALQALAALSFALSDKLLRLPKTRENEAAAARLIATLEELARLSDGSEISNQGSQGNGE